MGSTSDWETMQECCRKLDELKVPYKKQVVSAHRTPLLVTEYAQTARQKGLNVIIAAAGGAAHLPGMIAAQTPLPVIGVPIEGPTLSGLDSLLSIVQMPKGVPVATLAIGKPGAINAALLATQILAIADEKIAAKIDEFRRQQTTEVLKTKLD